MHYAYPHLAPAALLAAGVVAGLLLWAGCGGTAPAPAGRRTDRRPVLLVNRRRRPAKAALLLAAAGLAAFALVGPQWGQVVAEPPDNPPRGRDVLIVLDVSRSMLAEDVLPSRLARAKADVRDLAASLERQGGYRSALSLLPTGPPFFAPSPPTSLLRGRAVPCLC